MAKYSICVPVYNGEKYLKECIQSILNQTFCDFELILVDDCSSDSSYEICKEYSKYDKRIKLLRNRINQGIIKTELKAIKEARGEYLLFCDNDDIYKSNCVETIDNYINLYSPDLLMFGWERFYNDKIISVFHENKHIKKYTNKNRNKFLMKVSMDNNYCALWQKAIKRSCISNLTIPDERTSILRGNDKMLSAYIYKECFDVVFVDDVLYRWRDNPKNVTHKTQEKYKIEYRDKEAFLELINSDLSITINDKKAYDQYQIQQFKAQLIRISNLKITIKDKFSIFNDIRISNYYNKCLCKICKNDNNIEIFLFTRKHYYFLIILSIIKKRLINIK